MKSIVFILKLLVEWLLELIYFPFWWYTKGFLGFLLARLRYLGDEFTALGIGVWLKNIFVPMYGQRDVASWFISFFIRLFQVVVRTIGWSLLTVVNLILVIIWLVLPVLAISQIYHQFA